MFLVSFCTKARELEIDEINNGAKSMGTTIFENNLEKFSFGQPKLNLYLKQFTKNPKIKAKNG